MNSLEYWTRVAQRRAAHKAATIEARRARGTGRQFPQVDHETRRALAQQLAKVVAFQNVGKREAAKLWSEKLVTAVKELFK